MRRRQLAAVGVVLALLVSGCAGLGGPSTQSATTTTTTTATTTEASTTTTTTVTTTTDPFVARENRLVITNRNASAVSLTVRLEPFAEGVDPVVRNVTIAANETVDLTQALDTERDYVLTIAPQGASPVFERRAYRYEKYRLAVLSPTTVVVANQTAVSP